MKGSFESKPRVCFEVEKVIGVSSEGNTRSYQVQWAPAWVSSFHLVGCEHLIQEFLQRENEKASEHQLAQVSCQPPGISTTPVETGASSNASCEEVLEIKDGYQFENVLIENEKKIVAIQNNLVDRSSGQTDQETLSPLMKTLEFAQEALNLSASDADDKSNRIIATVKVENLATYGESEIVATSSSRSLTAEDYSTPLKTSQCLTRSRSLTRSPDADGDAIANEFDDWPTNNNFDVSSRVFNKNLRKVAKGKCKICNKEMSKYKLKEHYRIHKCNTSWVCSYCEKPFGDKRSLIHHIRTHTGEKPYSCDYCNKAFSIKSNLTTHLRVHTGHKPYSCNLCDMAFSHNVSLKRHYKTHTTT